MVVRYWCVKCRLAGDQPGSSFHLDKSGKWCDGELVEFHLDLLEVVGWQTSPPAPPTSNGLGVKRELWWFFGTRTSDMREFELSVVENALLGSGRSAWQMFMYEHDFIAPKEMVGYWRRIEEPPLPPTPILPRQRSR